MSASQGFTAGRLAVALSYGAGTAVVLYGLMLGGRRVTAPRATKRALPARHGRGHGVRGRADGRRARHPLPDRDRRQPARGARQPVQRARGECAARERLADLRGGSGGCGAGGRPTPGGRTLPVLGPAPEITGTQRWFNTPGGRPLSLASLRGKVVLIDFWTYSCINCIRTLPYLKAWDARYRDGGLNGHRRARAGVPVRARRRQRGARRAQNGLRYPVVQDNDFATWSAYRQRVLAGEVPDRRAGARALHPLRRGRLRRDGARNPLPARGGGRAPRRRVRAGADAAVAGGNARVVPGSGAGRALRQRTAGRGDRADFRSRRRAAEPSRCTIWASRDAGGWTRPARPCGRARCAPAPALRGAQGLPGARIARGAAAVTVLLDGRRRGSHRVGRIACTRS